MKLYISKDERIINKNNKLLTVAEYDDIHFNVRINKKSYLLYNLMILTFIENPHDINNTETMYLEIKI